MVLLLVGGSVSLSTNRRQRIRQLIADLLGSASYPGGPLMDEVTAGLTDGSGTDQDGGTQDHAASRAPLMPLERYG
jgi:hypothetical protein